MSLLNTIYNSGGSRITVSNDSQIIAVGSYYDGIEAYDIKTGAMYLLELNIMTTLENKITIL
ncbi:hypothetical protein [Flectobacillus major]|uniref:hypothetical protein n=1 Tax=Flectobacillus major TaxID=103 RepID=UPI000419ABF0|nr:hypothetical protein [Flectobacillus major]